MRKPTRKLTTLAAHLPGTSGEQNQPFHSRIGSGSNSGEMSRRKLKNRIAWAALAVASGLFGLSPVAHAQAVTADNGPLSTQQAASPAAGQPGAPAASPATQTNSNQANPNQTNPDQANPAGTVAPAKVRAVRLSDVEGVVQILHGTQIQFSQAVMNMPILQGSTVSTGADGRAEIEFEDGSVARLTPNTSLTMTSLATDADGTLNTTVSQKSGLVYYELRSDPKTLYSVDFGGSSATPSANSTFRVNLAASPRELAVIDGRVQIHGAPSDSYTADVVQGKTFELQPSGSAQYTIANGVLPSGFDEWNDQRDQEAAKEAQNQTPARVQQGGGSMMDGGFGWSDLDNAGGWYPLPGYGMVWQPNGIGAGFDPYGDGMWADMGGGFGYSWVSGYPWGWLPFHYGMWSYIGGFGWGWMPGAYGFGGGFGYGYGGYGGYGYGGYGYRGRYPATNVYGGPPGYHAPAPPTVAAGRTPPRTVPVGNPRGPALAAGVHPANLRTPNATATHGGIAPRTVNFNGAKIAPLHSMMSGVNVPVRNAALYNNYPSHAFNGNIRTAMMEHNASFARGGLAGAGGLHGPGGLHNSAAPGTAAMRPGMQSGSTRALGPGSIQARNSGSVGTLHGPMNESGPGRINSSGGAPFGGHAFGAGNRGGAFGVHSSFGSRGGFGVHSSGFHSGGGFHGGGGGFHGGGGGFHGGGGGGFHGGGGGGGHGGGGGGGGHGR